MKAAANGEKVNLHRTDFILSVSRTLSLSLSLCVWVSVSRYDRRTIAVYLESATLIATVTKEHFMNKSVNLTIRIDFLLLSLSLSLIHSIILNEFAVQMIWVGKILTSDVDIQAHLEQQQQQQHTIMHYNALEVKAPARPKNDFQ